MNDSRKPAWKKNDNREFNNNKERSFSGLRPLEVDVRNNDLEEAIKILRHKIAKDGVLAQLKNKRHAEKKSDKKRRKSREAIKKARRSHGKNSHPRKDY